MCQIDQFHYGLARSKDRPSSLPARRTSVALAWGLPSGPGFRLRLRPGGGLASSIAASAATPSSDLIPLPPGFPAWHGGVEDRWTPFWNGSALS